MPTCIGCRVRKSRTSSTLRGNYPPSSSGRWLAAASSRTGSTFWRLHSASESPKGPGGYWTGRRRSGFLTGVSRSIRHKHRRRAALPNKNTRRIAPCADAHAERQLAEDILDRLTIPQIHPMTLCLPIGRVSEHAQIR